MISSISSSEIFSCLARFLSVALRQQSTGLSSAIIICQCWRKSLTSRWIIQGQLVTTYLQLLSTNCQGRGTATSDFLALTIAQISFASWRAV
ncbi:hypothetical protein FGO68_gene4278 [Halteria grandinella]|uniref:Uncharacterized protein n=1 Tax=Halteria grandinella TaxID=5974 RepID=A0A8J8P1D6_HALGN|nr:hypothetical protein FGO68_gene4278 [Halteria grandinella]